ncbi:Uu.00g125110.m01.CDS01 [Anthostomella pinea]|uniref:Uu.00g125110.m01.CDS01 n=1 Tax=Anthostomella pinea TaxID=933095 RepID=A0AAI8YHT2_9PEZI|nr:Uu.00g125110.m01.CDS01 [Anthostomella pinea]
MPDSPYLSEDDLIQLSFLRDVETDALIEAGFLGKDEAQSQSLNQEFNLSYEELDLRITKGLSYPVTSITWSVDNHALSRIFIIELRAQLRQIAEDSDATNNISRWQNREDECDFGIFEPTMVVPELARETAKYVEAWRQKQALFNPAATAATAATEPVLPFEMKQPMANLAMTTGGIAYQFLQKTPQEITTKIPSSYRILHVEEVEDLVDYLVKPKITFHGTQRQYVPSIVQHDFLKPGHKDPSTGADHAVRCGSTYGRGIYSSPSADFSLSYTDSNCRATKPNEFFGVKLIVCATLMGRAAQIFRDDDWRTQSEPYEDADSHVDNGGREYIVFIHSTRRLRNTAQRVRHPAPSFHHGPNGRHGSWIRRGRARDFGPANCAGVAIVGEYDSGDEEDQKARGDRVLLYIAAYKPSEKWEEFSDMVEAAKDKGLKSFKAEVVAMDPGSWATSRMFPQYSASQDAKQTMEIFNNYIIGCMEDLTGDEPEVVYHHVDHAFRLRITSDKHMIASR